ncbi:MAG TPA: hypothetical protein VFO54_04945 [Chryseosolibacter sp.]|nr:hypothetical protein [Chryseosolibacter sp.]
MKTHTLGLLTTFITISTLLNAQDYAFKVLANKGNNEVKSAGTWQPLKTGASLKKGDEVKLADNSYLGLVHNSGRPLEVKQAGVYPVAALESKVDGGTTSVLNKYTDFILSSNSAEAQKNRLNATGAVHRDITTGAPIKLALPDNQHAGILNNTAIINWDGSKVAGPYVITVKNMFEDVLDQEETPETSYRIDLGTQKYTGESAILIEVSSKADPKQVSKQHLIKKLSPAEQQALSASLKELVGEVNEETPLNKLILAGFYEKNNLLIDAIFAYEQAIELAPDVPTFQESYEEFLLRNKLK